MARVLIVGCGDVGICLGKRLESHHEVWGLRRDVSKLPASFHKLAVDLGQPFELKMPAPDLVVYCAAAKSSEEAVYRTVYVNGLRHLLEALRPFGAAVKRLLFTSSTSVYHQEDCELVDESSPTEPTRFSGRILLEAEQLVSGTGLGVNVRFGGIYGPGRDRLLVAVHQGLHYPAQPKLFSNRIHRDDCAAMLEHLLFLAEPADVYIGTDGHAAPMHEVVLWMRARLEQAGVEPAAPRAGVAAPRRSCKRCLNTRIAESGFRFTFPDYRSGYEPLIETFARDLKAGTSRS